MPRNVKFPKSSITVLVFGRADVSRVFHWNVKQLFVWLSVEYNATRGKVSVPPDPAALFSEGGEVINLHIEGSLTIPKSGIKRV